MRLAYFSPLPPLPSGIADYSRDLLPYLSRHAEIDLFTDSAYQPVREISEHYSVHRYQDFPDLRRTRGYDAALYQLGDNANYHEHIYHTLLEYPGIVVLHEYVLQHLVREITLTRGNFQTYLEEVRYSHGQVGEHLMRLLIEAGLQPDPWAYPLFERVVDASLGVIVHNELSRQTVLAARPAARVAKINPPFYPGPNSAERYSSIECRNELGLPDDAFIIGSFGHIVPQKRLEASLRAFVSLRRELPQAIYVVVGGMSPYYNLRPILEDGLSDAVVLTGRVEMETFLKYMAAADVAINLRYPTGGETSATLIRLLGMGKPVIVSNIGSAAELPIDCCAKVDVDECEKDTLLAIMRELANSAGLRHEMGMNAQRHIRTCHTPEMAAQGYISFIQQVISSPLAVTPSAHGQDTPNGDRAKRLDR